MSRAHRGGWRRGGAAGVRTVAGALVVVALAVALAPDPVPLAGARLWALAVVAAGAAITVARTRAIDLAVGPTVGVGAAVGGILPVALGLPAVVGLPLGAVAGAASGALAGAVTGRVGRQLGALATLALGGAIVAVLAGLSVTGGVVGFHAVGLPTGLGDRVDALLVGGVAVVALLGAHRVATSTTAAAAAVAAADPTVARSLGRLPAWDAACIGAAGGAIVGLGGTLLATVDGSVVPAAYGLELTATVLAAAALGGAGPLGPVVGVLLVWGPATLFPLTTLGALPVLVTAGPLTLVVLAWRDGRPLTRPGPVSHGRVPPTPPSQGPARPTMPAATTPPRLRLSSTPTPAGPLDLTVAAGEVVAVTGPNGAGKSTLLARIGGQLPDGGTVAIDGSPAPRGARRRAQVGVARTWQHPPDVDGADLERLHPAPPGGPSDDLTRLVGRQPRVALLDEPTGHDPAEVASTLGELRAAGAAVVLVDHRPEVVAAADRVVALSAGDEASLR